MNQTTDHLNGKVTVYTLAKELDANGRFRGGDERGDFAMIVAGENIDHLEYAEFATYGVKRGFHFHEQFTEKIYVLKGSLILAIADIETREQAHIKVHPGEVVTMQPNVAHACFALENTIIVAMGSGSNPFKDRILYKDLSFSTYEK